MKSIAIGLLVFSVQLSAQTDKPSLRVPLTVYTTVAVADLASTIADLRVGGYEQNPLIASAWKHPALMLTEGAALEAGTVYVLNRFIARKHRKIATVIYYAVAGWRSSVVVGNLRFATTH